MRCLREWRSSNQSARVLDSYALKSRVKQPIDKRIMANEEVGRSPVCLGCRTRSCTAGIKTTSGSVAYADFVDDVVVERMRVCGAVILERRTAIAAWVTTRSNDRNLEHGPDARPQCRFGRCGSQVHGAVSLGSDGGDLFAQPELSGLYGRRPQWVVLLLNPRCQG